MRPSQTAATRCSATTHASSQQTPAPISARKVPLSEVGREHVVDVDLTPIDDRAGIDRGDHLALKQHGARRPLSG